MKNCPSCDAAAEDSARYCLECGHPFAGAAEPADPWQGREIAGRYRLVRKLGEGGMGEVYVAEQIAMDRQVALKLLREGLADDPAQVERFKREARAASRLSHPNTIILHDFGVDHDGTFYLAMELLEGETLAEVLRREGRLRPERTVALLSQVCGSLEEAHAQGVVHRDLKPENIFLTRRGGHPDFVKVLDFGIAKVRSRAAGESVQTLTHAGMIFGTPQYMSPEQIRGDELDARADVYALGVMLYQMISGHLPFQAGTPVEMLTKHLHATPRPIGDVDAAHRAAVARLEAVALRALSKDPDHRQPSAQLFQEDLMAAVPQFATAPMTGPLPAAPASEVVEAAPRGRGLVLAIAAFVLVAGAGTALWYNFGAPRDPGHGGGGEVPAVVPAPGEAEGSEPGGVLIAQADAPASEAAAPASEAAAPASEPAAPASEAAAEAPTAEEKAAEEEAKKVEAEEAPADPKAAEEMAKKLEAETAAAEAEKKAAEAEAKLKEAEEAKKAAEVAKAEAAAAKAAADAAKAESAANSAAAEAAKASAANAQAEVERLKAELEKAAADKAAAEAKVADYETKAEEAKAKAEAVRKRKKIASVAFGRVFVQSPVRGARVYVDGKLRGTTPISALRLKPGRHTVELRKDKKKKSQSVTVKANGVHRLRIGL